MVVVSTGDGPSVGRLLPCAACAGEAIRWARAGKAPGLGRSRRARADSLRRYSASSLAPLGKSPEAPRPTARPSSAERPIRVLRSANLVPRRSAAVSCLLLMLASRVAFLFVSRPGTIRAEAAASPVYRLMIPWLFTDRMRYRYGPLHHVGVDVDFEYVGVVPRHLVGRRQERHQRVPTRAVAFIALNAVAGHLGIADVALPGRRHTLVRGRGLYVDGGWRAPPSCALATDTMPRQRAMIDSMVRSLVNLGCTPGTLISWQPPLTRGPDCLFRMCRLCAGFAGCCNCFQPTFRHVR